MFRFVPVSPGYTVHNIYSLMFMFEPVSTGYTVNI